jgi:hypothetical protein
MKETELKALVSLLDDEDGQIVSHVEEKYTFIGTTIIPSFWKEVVGKQFQSDCSAQD